MTDLESSTSKPTSAELTAGDLHEIWMILPRDERLDGFRLLSRADAEAFFLDLHAQDQAELLVDLPQEEKRAWMRFLPPDAAADVAQAAPRQEKESLLGLLDDPTRTEVSALLAYAEDVAGGLMNPRFARLRPDMTVDEAISYLREQSRDRLDTTHYVYVLDEQQRLLGVLSFRELFFARHEQTVRDVMHTALVTLRAEQDQESVSHDFARHDLVSLPVVDAEGHLMGIVTVDDIVDVVREEATEDIQKIGGMEALEAPYLKIGFARLVKKRGGWLAVLFVGEMLTATAMGFFQDEIARAVVLALFVPLIISSGGNSGSQASTLVIRAMALGEIRLGDWWRVARREIAVGVTLGIMLGMIGFVRIALWATVSSIYGEHSMLVATTVFASLVGVVTFGSLAGSLLPFILRRLGFDPASASAPFVATLVDVTGLVIYFTVASVVLRGVLL